MKRYLLGAAGAVLLIVAPAYAEDLPPLRTAIDATFAPHAFPNLSGGGYQGFNIDLADAIAKLIKRKIVIDYAQFSGLVPALQAGTYDFLIAPTTVTKERAENMLFTEGYLNTDFQFMIKKGAPKIEKLEDLKGKIVSVNKGSAYDLWARNLEDKIGWKVEFFRHPDRCSTGSIGRPRRRQCRRQYGGRVGGQDQPAVGTIVSAFNWARLRGAAAQGFRRTSQDARCRRRMSEARRNDRKAPRKMARLGAGGRFSGCHCVSRLRRSWHAGV